MPLRILLAVVALLLVPATASADSIVFVKDANVWVASPDGSNLRQLTRDGTADQPYRSPSQADDGTVAASYRDGIRLISRGGTVIRELDPPPLTNSVSHAMDGTPVDVALSPAVPAPQCATGKLEGLHGPTWSPDGRSLAWGEPDGVWIKPSALDCAVQPSLVKRISAR